MNPNVNNDELLDLVDKNDQIIGSVWKSEAHQNPQLIHREVSISIFNDQQEVLLQQRSFQKKNGAGSWQTSAAGHVGSGEEPIKAIIRESEEELGLTINPIYFDKIFKKRDQEESRFFYIYYAQVTDHPKLTLSKTEVETAEWIKVDQLEEFAKTHDYNLNGLSHQEITRIAKHLSII